MRDFFALPAISPRGVGGELPRWTMAPNSTTIVLNPPLFAFTLDLIALLPKILSIMSAKTDEDDGFDPTKFLTERADRSNRNIDIIIDGRSYNVTYLDDRVDYLASAQNAKYHQFSKDSRYSCSAFDLFDGHCLCKDEHRPKAAFGHVKVRVVAEDNSDRTGWLCANCEQGVNLLEDNEEMTLVGLGDVSNAPYYECDLATEGEPSCEAYLCRYSCLDLAKELYLLNELLIRFKNPPKQAKILAMEEVLFKVERPGARRGSKHRSSEDNHEEVYEILYADDIVRGVFDETINADGTRFYFVIPVKYGEERDEGVSFVSHCDIIYLGKPPFRTNWTWDWQTPTPGKVGKIMRFQNRVTGWWFDIHCVNGCMVEQGHYASGIAVEGMGQGEIEHAIFNGKGRITITFDHGKKHYSQEEIDAAYAMLNGDDKNEDEE